MFTALVTTSTAATTSTTGDSSTTTAGGSSTTTAFDEMAEEPDSIEKYEDGYHKYFFFEGRTISEALMNHVIHSLIDI